MLTQKHCSLQVQPANEIGSYSLASMRWKRNETLSLETFLAIPASVETSVNVLKVDETDSNVPCIWLIRRVSWVLRTRKTRTPSKGQHCPILHYGGNDQLSDAHLWYISYKTASSNAKLIHVYALITLFNSFIMVFLSHSRNKHVRFSSRRVKWRQVLGRKKCNERVHNCH